ncbi:MAG TPA: hypothetical protein VFX17_02255 [Patescibacteria group bacterium]|nr:hypothetical protein [Patescibacteria group bacterium]
MQLNMKPVYFPARQIVNLLDEGSFGSNLVVVRFIRKLREKLKNNHGPIDPLSLCLGICVVLREEIPRKGHQFVLPMLPEISARIAETGPEGTRFSREMDKFLMQFRIQ